MVHTLSINYFKYSILPFGNVLVIGHELQTPCQLWSMTFFSLVYQVCLHPVLKKNTPKWNTDQQTTLIQIKVDKKGSIAMLLMVYASLGRNCHLCLKSLKPIIDSNCLWRYLKSFIKIGSNRIPLTTWKNSEIFLFFSFVFLTEVTHSWASAGPNCIIRRLCHSPMVSPLL